MNALFLSACGVCACGASCSSSSDSSTGSGSNLKRGLCLGFCSILF